MLTRSLIVGVARLLRRVIGVNERVLRRVPSERPRYTRLGAIVCLTAMFSALSMLVVTSRLFTGELAWLLAVGVTVFWGAFVLVIDSWLISSTHGTRGAKTLIYLPRLMVSVLLGFVIAEPVVILAFRPAIEQQVSETRETKIAAESSVWKKCNPATDEAVNAPECAGHRLALPGSPSTLRRELADLRTTRDNEAAAFDRDMNNWKQLDAVARAECAGDTGPDTTGVPGEGPECTRNRDMADQFRRDTRLEQRQADLAALDSRISDVQNKVSAAENTYGGRVQDAIKRKEHDARNQTIGILEELDALGQLAAKSVPVAVAQWTFRLLLILFDCMPVLAKWMSGATAYDRMVRRQIESDVESHAKDVVRHEEIESMIADAHKAELVREPRAALNERTEADRRAHRAHERRLDEEIERLFEENRGKLA